VDPAGGAGAVGVDELNAAAFVVGDLAGFADGDDDLAVGEGWLHFCGGVDDGVMVGGESYDVGVKDDGFILMRGREAGESKDVGDERTGVILIGITVRVVDMHGDLGKLGEVVDGEDFSLRTVDKRERVGSWDGRLGRHFRHGAGLASLSGEGEGGEQEGGEEELHGN